MDSSHFSPVSFMRPAVDAELADFVRRRRAEVLEIGEELAPVLDALEAMLAGGKRIRPAFCYWGWRGAGGPETRAIHVAAAALEFLQACALIHDDVIDNSDTRRGLPATHRRLAVLHASSGWTGDSAAFGQGAAVLLGDLCLAWCDAMYQSSGLSEAALRAGRPAFDLMRSEVMAGQYLDLVEQAREADTVDAALRVMTYKSAKYTIERPLHLGAALAGRHDELAPVYTAYGIPLGIAFQLRDDVLGVFGDPDETGKPAGDDLREGKRTVLVAETLRRAPAAGAAEFRRHLGDPDLSAETVEWMRDLITDSGALAACERRIDRYVAQATDALQTDAVADDARSALADLIVAATARKH
ncbi:polyprenyl synthetase family protein [Marinitenerispora sediminis]|uniref:Polyprenyl synthetase n=1 Tax=Marinitenerispora sediminis TaxID=1931232 RepID=A0A368TBX2_9ACTN|nr:polyprenyl synthetase family protein [Marinitenerispora sediminis]RCV55269.1 polyprenyl synthetase [Marinitenerispora sediminis]RCV61627.1 polyprenyl synthetase [Marinitenerispora sediminis]RCV62643.1 polyprenyl synthetase [Marinitenerispora sediminis]